MKVKRFNNLWAMGLILFGSLLVAFYVAKIFFPEFIVGVAEIPAIVKFGEYVDNNLWAYYLFYGIISYFVGYILCCIGCLKHRLNILQSLLCLIATVLLFVIEKFAFDIYVETNYSIMVLLPLICIKLDNNQNIKCLYSLGFSLSIHWLAQAITVKIRDILVLISYPNTATFTILMLDTFIWLILLYFYYNYKEK